MSKRQEAKAIADQIAATTGRRPTAGLVNRMLEAQKRERDVLVREMSQVRGLMPLLMRHRNGGKWSREERQQLVGQLNALAHMSPYLVVLALPGSFVMLPVLAWWLDRRRQLRAS